MKTRLFPVMQRFDRMYLADNDGAGGEGGGGASEGGDGGGQPAYEVPEKFRGSTPEETITKLGTSYKQLEDELARRGTGDPQYSKLEQQLAEQGELLRQLAKGKEDTPLDDEQIAAQKKYYKETLGLVGADELGSAVKQAQEAAVEAAKFDFRMKNLEAKYDGADGKPKFDPKAVSDYALSKGMDKADPETVYEHMHMKEIIDWQLKAALKKQAPPVPGSGKGAQQPVQKSITDFKTKAEQEQFLEDKIRAKLD